MVSGTVVNEQLRRNLATMVVEHWFVFDLVCFVAVISSIRSFKRHDAESVMKRTFRRWSVCV
jgi:hypothetical protein